MDTSNPNSSRVIHTRQIGTTSEIWGYVIVILTGLFFTLSMYTIFLSKIFSFSFLIENNKTSILKAIEQDVYYCYLIPLTFPISILAFYANWVSLKFFRHN